MKDKVGVVMKEFKRGDLKSSSGQKVTNPKQAIAIALSEAGKSKKGSSMKKMAAGGMPMVEKGGKMVPAFAADGKGKMAKGGMAKMGGGVKAKMGKVATGKPAIGSASKRADGVAIKGKTKGKMLAGGGMAKKMRSGGKTC
jgi:hypothetical protein